MGGVVDGLIGGQDNDRNAVNRDQLHRFLSPQHRPSPERTGSRLQPRPIRHALLAPALKLDVKSLASPLSRYPTSTQKRKTHAVLPGALAPTRLGLRIGLLRRWQMALEWENKWFGGPLAGLSEHNNAAMEDLAEQLGHR